MSEFDPYQNLFITTQNIYAMVPNNTPKDPEPRFKTPEEALAFLEAEEDDIERIWVRLLSKNITNRVS